MPVGRVTCPLLWKAALGAFQPCGVSLTTGGIAPASLRYDRLTPEVRFAGPRCLVANPLLGCVPACLSLVAYMAPLPWFLMQPGRARTSGLGVPLQPLARRVGWVAPVRWTLGVWFVAPCPSAALGACACAVSWATLRLFTSACTRCVPCAVSVVTRRLVTGARCVRYVCVVGGFVGDAALLPFFCPCFFLFGASVLLYVLCIVFIFFLCFLTFSYPPLLFFFLEKEYKRKGGACTLQAQALASGASVQQCCVLRCGVRRRWFVGGRAPGVRLASFLMYIGVG